MTRKVHALPEDELARLAGVSETTWKAHKKEGAPVPRNLAGINTWLVQYHAWRKSNAKIPSTLTAAAADPETMQHKRELAKLRVVLTRIEVGQKSGALINRNEVVDHISRANLTCRSRLNLMVQKARSQHGDEFADWLQLEVDSVCEAFAQGMLIANEDHTASAGTKDPGLVAPTEAPHGQ